MKTIIGVMGPGSGATEQDKKNALILGKRIAEENWVLLSGGVNKGVMDAVNKGAKEADGLTIGIMPTSDKNTFSKYVDIPVITDMKSARNNINVLSSNVVVACGIGTGTVSEVALALKANKKVILLNDNNESKDFFKKLDNDNVFVAEDVDQVIDLIKTNL
jgi:uncharacterized protein (TIGR00725 family)